MTKEVSRAITEATDVLVTAHAHTATVYLSEKETVRVTRRLFGRAGRKRFDPRGLNLTVTVGRPNYSARAFIKLAKRAGERFPLSRIQLSFPKGK